MDVRLKLLVDLLEAPANSWENLGMGRPEWERPTKVVGAVHISCCDQRGFLIFAPNKAGVGVMPQEFKDSPVFQQAKKDFIRQMTEALSMGDVLELRKLAFG